MNEQQKFWAQEYARQYIEKNKDFDLASGVACWKMMLAKAGKINSVLECGCNIGRNIRFLNEVLPEAEKSIIEISEPAYQYVNSNYKISHSFNGPIVNSNFAPGQFDLTFTVGVLIHISPADLLVNMQRLYGYSSKYVLMAEYFNRTPVMLEYQGQKNKLFKRDFGKLFLENHNVTLLDYGFLWGHLYDKAGFDDITWWLFEKNDR